VVAAVVVAAVITGATAFARTSPSAPLTIRGADVSFTLQEERAGTVLHGADGQAPIEDVLSNAGATYVRLRVWVNPTPGTSDLTSALKLARRAAARGLGIVLALQYSDTWADNYAQQTPSAWAGQSPKQLARTVEQYTAAVVGAFTAQRTPVDVVQVGNEIDNGLLWPVGNLSTGGWDTVAALLRAAVSGARAGGLGSAPRVMLHLASSGDLARLHDTLAQLIARGVDVDVIGLSYYTWWNGSLEQLGRTLASLADDFHTDLLLAETAYPWTLADADDEPNAVTSTAQLPDGASYPPTPAGQAAWFNALRNVLAAVPGGHGIGFLDWEPGWLPGVPAAPGVGSTYDNTTMFDWQGRALPALAAMRPLPRP
jgi:arabinogalactan endo-1,4-beta-galactosidase